jgi:2-iminobutanoate/2-iminopropanoate deaminase
MPKSRRREIESGRAPRALGPYNQAMGVAGPGLVFVSGQIGIDPATGDLVAGGIKCQTEQCMRNILEIVRAAGGTDQSLVKTTIYLADLRDFQEMNQAYSEAIRAPYPARSCLGGCDLPKGALVEIEAVAVTEALEHESR